MKRCYVIEVDDDGFVRVLDAAKSFDAAGVIYRRNAGDDTIMHSLRPDARFYGRLDILLNLADRIEHAEPITPEVI